MEQRHVRFVQSDPDHVAGLAARGSGLINGDIGEAPAIDIGAGRDDAIGGDGFAGDVGLPCNARVYAGLMREGCRASRFPMVSCSSSNQQFGG
jgi:hypothetical protein